MPWLALLRPAALQTHGRLEPDTSRVTPFLSIVIACWNEPENLAATIQSIDDTAEGFPIEIIIVDDGSSRPFDWPSILRSSFHIVPLYNAQRKGHAACRQMGSETAAGEWLLFTDAHMVFEMGWFEAFKIQTQHHDSKTLFGGPYVFSRIEWEREQPRRRPELYHGARFYYWERDGDALDILGYKPRGAPENSPGNWPFEVPCVIGANYFLRRDWFQTIGGLKTFYGWSGMDEFMLSVKTWLFGGSVKIIPDVRLRHVLHPTGRGFTGYGKEMSKTELLYNKLAGAFELFPQYLYDQFLSALPRDGKEQAFQEALAMMAERREQLNAAADYFAHNSTRGHEWLCSRFKLYHPADVRAAQFLAP
jgi:glycosyltransferase involved in cell wall biosynthesis